MKDHFSQQAPLYARYRPQYPDPLFEILFSITKRWDLAWDVATGSGQVARHLAPRFTNVVATDISEMQLRQAPLISNISYKREPAESTSIKGQSVDLITIGQAIHWFHFDEFYREVRRVAKPHALIAAFGYHLVRIRPAVDDLVFYLYEEVLSGCWNPERRYIDSFYRSIPFPFAEIETPPLTMRAVWSRDDLFGFLSTWSGVQHFRKKYGYNPIDEIQQEIRKVWPDGMMMEVSWPVFIRAGYVFVPNTNRFSDESDQPAVRYP